MGKTSSEVKNRYNAKAYDRLLVCIYKGNKDILKAQADKCGCSLSAYIKRAVEERYKAETGEEIEL